MGWVRICVYTRLERLKGLLNQHLGKPVETHIPEGLVLPNRYFAKLYPKFFRLLEHV